MKKIQLLLIIGLLTYGNPAQAAEMQILGAASSAKEIVQELPTLLKEYTNCAGCVSIDKKYIINKYAAYRQQQSEVAAMTSLKRHLREKISAAQGRGKPMARDAKGNIIKATTTTVPKGIIDRSQEFEKKMDSDTPDLNIYCSKSGKCNDGRHIPKAELELVKGKDADIKAMAEELVNLSKTPDGNDDDCDGASCGEAKANHNTTRSNQTSGVMKPNNDDPCNDPENPGVGCDEAEMLMQDIKIDGIDGESKDEKHEDWIEILSFAKASAKDIKIDGIDGESKNNEDGDWIELEKPSTGVASSKISDSNGDWIEILSVQASDDNTGKIKGVQKKSLFGIFAVSLNVEADVAEDGTLHNISKPWYAFLAW